MKNEKVVKVLAIIGIVIGIFGGFLSISERSIGLFFSTALLIVWGSVDLKYISSKRNNLKLFIKFFAVLGVIIGSLSFIFSMINNLGAAAIIGSLFWVAWGIYDFRMLSPKNLFDKKIF